MSSLEWSDDEEQAVDVPAPSNFSIAYTMATDDCIPLKSSLMGQSSMMAQPVGPGPVEEGHQVEEEEEEEEKTEATPQAPEEKAEFKTPQANGTGAAEASATHRPTEIDTTPKQETSPTSAYDENCDDAEIARNLQDEFAKALGGMDGSMTGWDFREELLNEDAPKCEVVEIEDEENEADAVNPLKARFCESVQRSNYKKRLQMKEEVAIASENSEGDGPGKKKMKTHEKEVAEVKEVAAEEIKQGVAEEEKKQEVAEEEKKKEVADEEIKQGVAEEEKKQEVAEEEKKKEVAGEEIKQGGAEEEKKQEIAEEEKKKEVAGEEIKQGGAEVAEEEKKKKVAEEEEKKNAAEKEKKKKSLKKRKRKKLPKRKRKKSLKKRKRKKLLKKRKRKKLPKKRKRKKLLKERKTKKLRKRRKRVAKKRTRKKLLRRHPK